MLLTVPINTVFWSVKVGLFREILTPVTYSHHLPIRLEVGASYSMALLSQVSISYPRVSRGSFSPGNGCSFLFLFMSYAAPKPNILFPSFRILTAAFTSRSMIFPQEQIYIRSDSFRSSFIFPQQLQSLLDGKKRSIFTNVFCFLSSLYSSIFTKLP